MNNRFKNGERVWIIKGIGKVSNKYYYRNKGKIICRDPYYMDYNVLLDDGSDDWFDGYCLRKIGRRKSKNENKKHKNSRF